MSNYGVEQLVGLTLTKVQVNGAGEIIFETNCGRSFRMDHEQNCCEDVTLEDINGDVNDLIGEEILEAREDTNSQVNEEGSLTWTFYTIKSRRGTVVIRWYGTSNGFYSEAVDVTEILEEDDGI